MLPVPSEPMTIHELKAHLDRRFDRLERVKADRTELRKLAAKSDRRWAATKRAFRRFATKNDVKRLATKDDLKRFATKDDFKRLEERLMTVQKVLQSMLQHHGRILDDHERRIGDLERVG
jgi:molecular chaperone GrpE (heat shock protein)